MGKKKEKITYVDDGRTIADMSGIKGGFRLPERNPYQPRASMKAQWETYKNAVKMMITPMLVVIVGICIIYMLVWVAFTLM